MVIVDVPANLVYMGPVLPQDTNFPAVRYPKQLRIIRCDKSNTLFRLFQMIVKEFSLVAIAVNRVHSLLGIQAQEIGIIFRIRAKRKILAGKVNRTVDLTVTVR